MKRRFTPLAFCLSAMGAMALMSCDSTAREEENASVVNIEKGVTSPMSVTDADAAQAVTAEEPVGLGHNNPADTAQTVTTEEQPSDNAPE